jgi:DNA polymerase-1
MESTERDTGDSRRRLLVFDLSNLVFRAYFALPRLTTSRGEPTGAVLGVLRMVRKTIRERSPDAVAVAMDSPVPVRRKTIYEAYKANRPPAPRDLEDQIPVIERLLGLMGLESFTVPGWEADDVIATLTRRALAEGLGVEIVSGDKDLAQLVCEDVVLVADDPAARRSKVLDSEAVAARWGVGPERIRDLLALTGDSSDNVPGVPKVGPKTAVKLISEHGSLPRILDAAPSMKKSKLRENLIEHGDDARLSFELVSLEDDLDLEPDWEALRPIPAAELEELDELAAELDRLELRELLVEILEEAGADGPALVTHAAEKDYGLVADLDELRGEVQRAARAGAVSLDLETTSRSPVRAEIVGVSLASEQGRGRYVAVGHRYMGAPAQPPLEEVLSILGPLLEDPSVSIYGQNLKYEDVILKRHGLTMRGVELDTMIASYLLDPERHQHKLDQIALDRLGYRMISYDEVTRKQRGRQLSFEEVPVEEAARYSAEDAEIVWSLADGMRADLEEAGLMHLMRDLEIPLSRVLADMELAGVGLDTRFLAELESRFESQLAELESRAHAAAGREFNLSSPKQLQAVLFEELGLSPVRRTKTGFSTDMETLTALSAVHELPAVVLEHRALSKLLSTYVRALPAAVDPRTGRVHTSYNQAVAATGRLSSSEPNLQNIPVRSDNGRLIRSAFRASEGRVLMSADYSQIELRVLAHLSTDPDLVEAFLSGEDVHARTASQVFGVPIDQVDPELRWQAKAINFGVIYGQTDYGLSQQLGIARREAARFIERYFQRYTGVKEYMDAVVARARDGEAVKTLLGRRRYLRGIASRSHVERANAERMARNTPIQGTAADIIKLAMVRVHEALEREGREARMVLTVHDELVLDVPEDERREVEERVTEIMQTVMELAVPMVVDVGWGEHWGQAHP